MATESSDKAQQVWQNIILLAYASCIAAIPAGDAFLFSFTAKKPLAIGVARSIFVSTLGASLAMVFAFVGWLISECVFPSLQIDHFFYQLIERRIKAKAFTHIIAIFVLVELVLLLLTVGIGGFLAFITTFVGEQNQKNTRFSFISLLIDVPIGLSIVSFIQAFFCASIFLVSHLRGSPAQLPVNHKQDQLFMMNRNASMISAIKANRRVTFKTNSETSNAFDSKRSSDVSGSSSTSPVLRMNLKEDESVRRIPSAASSRTTLLPIYHHRSSSQTNNVSIMPPRYQNTSSPSKLNEPSGAPAPAPPPAAHTSKSSSVNVEPSGFSLPKFLSKPTFFSNSPVTSTSRFPSATTDRYSWLKPRANKDVSSKNPSPYTRVGASEPGTPMSSIYQRGSNQNSTEILSKVENKARNASVKRKSVPIGSLSDANLLSGRFHDPEEGSESDDGNDNWAEAHSQISHLDTIGSNAH